MRMTLPAALVAAIFPLVVTAAQPNISPEAVRSADTIVKDPVIQKILAEAVSDAGQKWRFNTQMELTRIASPSRFEMRRQAEITKRLAEEWGFASEDIMTRLDGYLKGAGLQTVDGLPVYNVCVRIPGTYGARPDAVTYQGEGPKVLLEGHIDTVNPGVLPPAETPYEPVKLQSTKDAIVKTRGELAAIKDELHFDDNGRIIEDDNYRKAYQRYADYDDAQKKGAYRIYVPGYNDAMINTTAVLQAAVLMKKYGVKPVYDIWVCGTTGEEGKGNLCGMKQLYGYSQEAGKGNNALNFVASFSADTTRPKSGIVNYLGSYRFEMKYTEPADVKAGAEAPSAAMAMNRAVAAIADLKTPYDDDRTAERTTYTVGLVKCSEAPAGGRSRECTLMVDMRSPTPDPLTDIRRKIEPQFEKALTAENTKYSLKNTDKNAVKMELVWFGDRPAYKRTDYDDVATVAWWQSSRAVGVDVTDKLNENAASLNDNVPAAVGVPTVNFNVGTNAGGGGGHAFWEWGIPGDGVAEGKRLTRMIVMGLMAAGFNTSDGKVVEPLVGPMGNRTTEERFK